MATETEAIYQAIGARIKMMREFLGVDQATVAKRAGISRPALANIECGRQRILPHTIAEIANALGSSPKALMKGIWW